MYDNLDGSGATPRTLEAEFYSTGRTFPEGPGGSSGGSGNLGDVRFYS